MAEGVDELSAFLIGEKGIDVCAKREEKQAVRGAYGFVFKVTVQGVERIGKKLHSSLNVSGSKMRSNFRDECAEKEEKQASRGSYGFVFKVTVQEVERIGKKLHSAYVNNVSGQEKQAITARFRNECVILVTVQEVERIGKKLHSAYVNNVSGQEKQAITARFRNECVILVTGWTS